MSKSPVEGTNTPFDSADPDAVGRFRLEVAGAIKDLLIAREREFPGTLPDSVAGRWEIRTTSGRALPLLVAVAQKFDRILDRYCGYQNSEPFPTEDEVSDASEVGLQFEAVRDLVILFVDPEILKTASRQLRANKDINWQDLARWDLLPEIRDQLDKLPLPRTELSGPSTTGPSADLVMEPPGTICYHSIKLERVQKKVWLLIDNLLRARHNKALIEDLAGPVWEEWTGPVSDDQVRSVVRRATATFGKYGVPFRVSRRGRHLILGTTNSVK